MDPSEILHFMGILHTVHSQSLGGLEDNLGNVNNGDKHTCSKAPGGSSTRTRSPRLGTKGSTSCPFNSSCHVIETRLFAQSTNWMLPPYWLLLVLHMPPEQHIPVCTDY